jgi:hypothetical protein
MGVKMKEREIERIKEKIKKLFALSKSSNANEASVALEMAQKLMEAYGVERNTVSEFEIIEQDVKGNSGKRPPQYEIYLVNKIAGSFGCESAYGVVKKIPKTFYDIGYYDYEYGHTFVGLEHKVKIAAFISDILLRKLKKARKDYLKKLNLVRIRGNKIKRADDFCLGWVVMVIAKLHEFTNTADEQRAIDTYVANLDWGEDLKTISRGTVKKSSVNDYINGREAASGVQIQHGLEGRERGAPLLESV